jgi:hypothetical protein
MGDRGDFARRVLAVGGWPTALNNHVSLVGWMAGEGTAAKFNPLATTRPEPGSTPFNTVPVQNYVSWEQGVKATVDTLKNGRYAAILACLRAHDVAAVTLAAVDASDWGTSFGGDPQGFADGVEARWSLYAFVAIPS